MSRNIRCLASLAPAMLLSACASPNKLAAPPQLVEIPISSTAAERVEDDALRMGDATVVELEEEPLVSRRIEGTVTELRGYAFTLIDREGTAWSTRCNARKQSTSGAIDNTRVDLSCAIESDGVSGPIETAELALFGRDSGGKHRTGALYERTTTLDIYSKHEVVEGRGSRGTEEPVGFEIMLDDRVVGAVQTKGSTILWMDAELAKPKTRALVGASAAALLWFDRDEQN